jgi:hypothetical protein
VRVPRVEIEKMGISGKISPNSRCDDKYIYLCEKVDMKYWVDMLSSNVEMMEEYSTRSPIRKKKRYKGGIH